LIDKDIAVFIGGS